MQDESILILGSSVCCRDEGLTRWTYIKGVAVVCHGPTTLLTSAAIVTSFPLVCKVTEGNAEIMLDSGKQVLLVGQFLGFVSNQIKVGHFGGVLGSEGH